MRCPDCNKFVSYEEPQCEVSSVEVEGEMLVGSITVQLNCAECGTTLKESTIETDNTIEHECKPKIERQKEWKPDPSFKEGDEQFIVEDEGEPSSTDRMEIKDRHGKPIKNYRYQKHFYGFELESEIKCLKCGEIFNVRLDGEEQASAFDECC